MSPKTRACLRFSGLEFVYFATAAVLTYQTSYLSDCGLTSAQIGLIVSLSAVAGMVALPVWGRISDRFCSARAPFLLCITVMVLAYAALALWGGAWAGRFAPFAALLVFASLFKLPANSLMDGWGVAALAPHGVPYSKVRMWGSIGFAIVSLGLGRIIHRVLSVPQAFLLMPLWLVPLYAFAGRGRPGTAQENCGRGRDAGMAVLWHNRRFLIYLMYTLGLCLYLGVTMQFLHYVLLYAHCDPGQLGYLVGFRAVMEIVAMFTVLRWQKRIPLARILILSGLLFGLEHLLYQFAQGMPLLFVAMALSGFAGGIFYGYGPSYVFEIVPPQVQNTAQAMCGMTMSLVTVFGSAFGGISIQRWGIDRFTCMCGVLILSLTAVFALSVWRDERRDRCACV